jgi:hypothetical protein
VTPVLCVTRAVATTKSHRSIAHFKHVKAQWSAQRPEDKFLFYLSYLSNLSSQRASVDQAVITGDEVPNT